PITSCSTTWKETARWSPAAATFSSTKPAAGSRKWRRISRRERSIPSPGFTADSAPIAIFVPPPKSGYPERPNTDKQNPDGKAGIKESQVRAAHNEVPCRELHRRKLSAEKLRGRFRVPGLKLTDTSLSASFSSLPFSWLPWFYSPFHFSWTT